MKAVRKNDILLVGHPNVGKSALFQHLTGTYAVVSNYPGTTVEITEGMGVVGDVEKIVDSPGINTILPQSEEEMVTRDLLLQWEGVIVQVGDAKNLGRTLALTFQLALFEKPMVLVLNMMDEARALGISINIEKLKEVLGIPIIPAVAVEGEGIRALLHALPEATVPQLPFTLEDVLGKEYESLKNNLKDKPPAVSLMLFVRDDTLKSLSHLSLPHTSPPPPPHHVLFFFLRQANRLADGVLTLRPRKTLKPSKILDTMTLHPFWGLPVLFLSLIVGYGFVGLFGAGTMVDFFENVVFGQWLLPPLMKVFQLIPIAVIRDAIIGEFGILTMAIPYAFALILPIVTTFFLFFSFLEDSGYLPRLSAMVHRLFALIGLSGKAVLPMILGLGCDTMATLTTRILPTKKERILVTLLLALGIPCSAQLAVILAMMESISIKGTVIWAVAILFHLFLVGAISSYLIPGRRSPFVMELPPLRLPRLSNLWAKTSRRILWYLKEVVPIFIGATLLLFLLDKVGFLHWLQNKSQPLIVDLLHLPAESSNAFLMGFFRRDYGAAGFFHLQQQGHLDPIQTIVSMVTITLFIPCIANLLIIWKERGWKVALGIVSFIIPYAFFSGVLLDRMLRLWKII